VLPRNCERDLGEGGARRGHTGRAEDGVGQGLSSLGRVHRTGVEVQFLLVVEAQGVVEVVQLHLEVALQPARRCHVAGIALVAQADVLDRLALTGEFGMDNGVLHAETAAPVDVSGLVGGLLRTAREPTPTTSGTTRTATGTTGTTPGAARKAAAP